MTTPDPSTKPTIPEVIEDFRRYVACPGNESGGSLHLVLDDFNVEDSHVQWCAEEANRQDDEEGKRLAGVLLSMSKTQRLKLAKLCWHPDEIPTVEEAAGWLRERAESWSQDARILKEDGDLPMSAAYATIAGELRKCADQLLASKGVPSGNP